MNPFDYLNAINDTKQNVIEDSDNPELAEKLYPPYLVNRGLSFFIDTVYLANEMNRHHHLNNKMQFDFLINIVRKKKRFSKWFKAQPDEEVEAVMDYYGYSQDKARQVVSLLTKDQITQIIERQRKGGLNDGISRSDG
ncbi:MAG: DNA polymerase clamp loader subunit A [Rhodospirillales bacterium]